MTVPWHLSHPVHGKRPWNVQAEALRRANGHTHFAHWLEMGLGKTALNLNEFINSDDVDINLVICPNSFRMDWKLAPAEWGLPFVQTGMWPRDPLPTSGPALYAVNYEAVRYDPHGRNTGLNTFLNLMKSFRVMLTIDESKAIGNPSSKTSMGVQQLANEAVMVRLLNGTPMTESVLDYFGQLRALGLLHGWTSKAFKNRYATVDGFMGRQVTGINEDRSDELARLLDQRAFRALKKDWRKDLPPQVNAQIHLEMTNKQRQHYQTMLEEFYVELDSEDLTVDLIITQQEKLRQISSCLVKKDKEVHWLEKPADNPKVQALLDLIEAGPTKMIVVYMYRDSGSMLVEALKKYKPAWLRGTMKPEEIQAEKNRFNADPKCRVIVCQEVAAARGHTLLGGKDNDRCNRMAFYENHFGLYWREQMKDRNHRGEQDLECTLYDLITSPLEQLIVDRLVLKKDKATMVDEWMAAVRKEAYGAAFDGRQ